jgi:ABC-type transport system involved in cytochrome c biogenesis permease subunit
MATATIPNIGEAMDSEFAVGATLQKLLAPLASLKLTVALLSLSVFLVLAGTMAQVDKDIWKVVDDYFRCELAWIDLQIFFPPAFFPSPPDIPDWMVIPFPGGRLIGSLMFLNLLAAHGLRFKPQAKGLRLLGGVGVIALGVLTTWLVVVSGNSSDGIQSEHWVSWDTLWLLFKLGLTAMWGGAVYAVTRLGRGKENDVSDLATTKFVIGAAFSAVLGLMLAWLWIKGDAARLDDSSMRILWQLLKGTFAGAVLLAGCVMVFKKRAGVVLLHGGIGLLMFSELLVGLTAVESQITLQEGETTNFSRDIRFSELAIVTKADTDADTHTVVLDTQLQRALKNKSKISDERLPFDIEVLEFYKNARVRPLAKDQMAVATKGIGTTHALVPIEASTGVDMDSKVDLPGAYVRLTKRGSGEDLGTYLVSVHLSEQNATETLEIDSTKYDLSLRFRRYYKPYTVQLLDVDGTNYIGTNTARNYSSDVRIVDKEHDKDFNFHIWMNNPLRFAGETFYQSGFTQAEGTEYSTLQLVTNTGWMIPYVACMIVAVGMLFQFGVTLLRFLDRRARETKTVTVVEAATGAARWVPILAVAFLTLWVGGKAKVPAVKGGDFDYAAIGHLPVVADGRVKPLDTYARNLLRIISGSETFKREYEENGKTKTVTEPAIRWFMDMVARPNVAKHHKVLRIENLEVLKALNLAPRKGFRYSMAEIVEQPDEKDKPFRERRFVKLGEKTDAARQKGTRNMSVEDRKAIEFERKFGLYETLSRFAEVPEADGESPLDRMQRGLSLHASLKNSKLPFVLPPLTDDAADQWDFLTLAEFLQPLDERPEHRFMVKDLLGQLTAALESGRLNTEEDQQLTQARKWLERRYPDVVKLDVGDLKALTQGPPRPPHPGIAAWRELLSHYRDGDASACNVAVRRYLSSLEERSFDGVGMTRIGFEWFFNFFQPFFLASMLDFFAFLIAAVAMLGWSRTLNRTAFAIIALSFALHTFAIIARIVISGRPPVTNLYSTAVFIGWGIVLLGMIFERIYRMGVGNLLASFSGFATLLIAHFLGGDGDTFTVLVAVLDTQFWLATHVTTINLGYATTFLAGLMGVLYLAMRTPFLFAFVMSAVVGAMSLLLPGPIAQTIEAFTEISLSANAVKWIGMIASLAGIGATAWASTLPQYRDAAPLTPEREKNLSRMLYGTLCFGIFFSFVGTVLGGLWADDSWGRFWGWDPKENGALIIVLWNAVVLHARWGGLVKNRGTAVLAIGGNIATAWSWFGVNELGVGLHSYGFTEGVLLALALFAISQLAVIGIGCVPLRPRGSVTSSA